MGHVNSPKVACTEVTMRCSKRHVYCPENDDLHATLLIDAMAQYPSGFQAIPSRFVGSKRMIGSLRFSIYADQETVLLGDLIKLSRYSKMFSCLGGVLYNSY